MYITDCVRHTFARGGGLTTWGVDTLKHLTAPLPTSLSKPTKILYISVPPFSSDSPEARHTRILPRGTADLEDLFDHLSSSVSSTLVRRRPRRPPRRSGRRGLLGASRLPCSLACLGSCHLCVRKKHTYYCPCSTGLWQLSYSDFKDARVHSGSQLCMQLAAQDGYTNSVFACPRARFTRHIDVRCER